MSRLYIPLLIISAILIGAIDAGIILLAFPEAQIPRNSFIIFGSAIFSVSALLFIAMARADLFRLKKYFVKEKGELSERMERTSEFVSVIAHQLRSPMTAINWALNALRKGEYGKLAEDQEKIVARAQTSAQYLIDLVTNLLHLARMEQNRLLYNFTDVDTITLAERVISRAKLLALEREIALKFDKPNTPLPNIQGDREKLEIVLENLLDNAIKYTPKNGEVTIALKRDTLGILMQVSDNGHGIPPAIQERIFTKFYRGENTQHVQGIGLGLYITKNIVEGHKGTIAVKSIPGEGSTFSVYLPLKQSS